MLKAATLSRGFGRKSHGFILADMQSSANEIGDEPRMFKQKFPETAVAVGEDRVIAIPRILQAHEDLDVIFLDDAYQHRSIQPGLSILLTEYSNPFTRDALLPVGWLREPASGYHRADIIIVTKCPADLSTAQRQMITAELKPYKYQKVYFSTLQYGPLYSFINPGYTFNLAPDMDVLLVCGIARYDELKNYLESKSRRVYVRDYRDHHRFDVYDLEAIRETFKNLGEVKKVMVATEKDAMRLAEYRNWFSENKIEIFVQPVVVSFLGDDGDKFNADILKYIEVTKQKIQA